MGSNCNNMEGCFINNHKKNGFNINIDDSELEILMKSKVGNGLVHQRDNTKRQQQPGGSWLKLNPNVALLKSVLPCLTFLVVYGLNDTIRFLPGISDLHCVNFHNISALEHRIFSGQTPHLVISAHHNPLLDVLSALPYLFHYTIPVLFPLFLSLTGMRDKILRFFRLLSLAMWSHYFIWFLFPTAPPWLAESLARIRPLQNPSNQTPFDVKVLTSLQREGCAFARLDAATGWGFFKRIFDGNPVPFASFPSGHVAWPVCMALTAIWSRRAKTFLFLYIAWVGWSTMYSCHHYFSDIVAAVVVVILMDFIDCWYYSRHHSCRY